MNDLRLALRSLARTPGFTAVVALTLALGIGASTTVFGWVERVLLHPLPGVSDPSRVVALETRAPSGNLIDTSYPDYLDYRAATKSLSDIAVFKERMLALGEGQNAQQVFGELVSANFFDLLGVRPVAGRFFNAADRADTPASAPVLVIGESLWRMHFNADPTVVGRTVKLNRQPFTVIGVAPASFFGSLNGVAFDVWVPVMLHPRLLGPSPWLEQRGWRALHTLGRLAPGATLADVRAELSAHAAQLALAHPNDNRNVALVALPIARSPHGIHALLGRPLLLLFGVCLLLLLMVCANVSNLLLVRATARQRELSIRQALGATRGQLVRQLLSESLLLAFAGAALGLVMTAWLADLLRQFVPVADIRLALDAPLDPVVIAVALALTIGTAVLSGLASLWWATRPDAMIVLRAGSRSGSLTPRAEFARSVLVVTQVTLAFLTLACTALAIKSFRAARQADPGFDATHVLLAGLKLDASGYTRREEGLVFLDRLQQRLGSLPGVESAALAEDVPLGLSRGSWEIVDPAGYVPKPNEDMRVYRNRVSPGYFNVMRIPLLAGREFNADDRRGRPVAAIVNETFARRYFGTTEAIGRTFTAWGGDLKLTVVGVARDIKIAQLGESAAPYYYVPLAQLFTPDTGITIQLRTRGDPIGALPSLRALLREVDPNVPIFAALSLEDYVSVARFAQRTAASLLGVLAAMSLVLTGLGLYGVLAFSVAQRTPEIGVRLALGAQPGDIAALVVRRAVGLMALGLGIGLAAALAVSRLLATAFYGLSHYEPALLALVVLPLVLTGMMACLLPARRAARVDPVVALRAE